MDLGAFQEATSGFDINNAFWFPTGNFSYAAMLDNKLQIGAIDPSK